MTRTRSVLNIGLSSLLLIAILCSSQSASAIFIAAPYIGPALPPPILGGLTSSSTLAATTLGGYFSDPGVALHFKITSTPMGLASGILGYFDVDPVTSPYSYSTVAGALGGDATSADDFTAVSSFQPGPALYMITNDTTSAPTLRTFVSTPSTYNTTLRLPRAQQKALGLLAPGDGGLGADGTIILNSDFLPMMDFTPGDGIASGMFDMTAILMHEMAHGMGFISGVDHIDYASSDGAGHDGDGFPHDYSGETIFTVLDLYRYSDESVDFITQPSAGKVLDWAAGSSSFLDNPYFSIDAGGTELADFSTGVEFGDGFQAQHWKELGASVGLMDPDIDPAELGVLKPLDVTALDVIGWTLVPEPSSVVLAGMGLATVVVVGWRRRMSRA
jgi:hypothetical protein